MKIDSLRKLYVDQLKDLHNAESQLIEALPKMAKAASSDELAKAFEHHLDETKTQKSRIETIFKSMSQEPGGEKCQAMAGLVEEAEHLLDQSEDPRARDAALVCAAQKVEHYEIGSYGSVCAYATMLGENEAADLLHETLNEEKAADAKLTGLAEDWINEYAKANA